ncbi:sorting nexin-17-like isoform X1 [Mercenaria mercenaria]|uniref:sorting nexin-17-like isoform X1 n=1 Tax=Mercenaria mercenaria TaxID=6596 RepID=UPI00234F8D36|nr:sorting nexin-17-like isoform X1 [Mercenaria mercenaria]
MHFSIPDTQEITDGSGSTYTSFNIHINGVFHCTARFSLLHSFHEQLKKEFGATALPPFPPKKLFPIAGPKLDERRLMLERYIQIVSQEAAIANSDVFNSFLLTAQQETQKEQPENVSLDVYLMNGHKISVNIISTDQTEDVLETVASQIDLPDDFVYYFGLYLVRKEDDSETSIVRKLQDFESPSISLKSANLKGVHRIVLRKCFWDSSFDDELLANKVAMNLLYVQAVSDIDRQWVLATKDQKEHLKSLQQKGSKREFLRLARTLKHYGYIQFHPCTADYPQANSRVVIAAGNKELNFRILVKPDAFKEAVFKITRIRCWRITTTVADDSDNPDSSLLELSFEYLIAKDTLQWITVQSEQAILMSMCLQGMVEELIMKKQGRKIKKPSDRVRRGKKNFTRENSIPSGLVQSPSSEKDDRPHLPVTQKHVNKTVSKLQDLKLLKGKGTQNGDSVTNSAFEDAIGDDDL